MKQIINNLTTGKKEIIEQRNLMHFQVQQTTRAQVVKSKKVYNRQRDRKVEW